MALGKSSDLITPLALCSCGLCAIYCSTRGRKSSDINGSTKAFEITKSDLGGSN